MNHSHSSIYVFDTELRQRWFNQLGVANGLKASNRLCSTSHRLIHTGKVVSHILPKELF